MLSTATVSSLIYKNLKKKKKKKKQQQQQQNESKKSDNGMASERDVLTWQYLILGAKGAGTVALMVKGNKNKHVMQQSAVPNFIYSEKREISNFMYLEKRTYQVKKRKGVNM